MITGVEDIAELFSTLHDGVVVDASTDGGDLVMRVKITYLAERIEADFTTFTVRLFQVEDIGFLTWPNDAASAPQTLHDLSAIFVPSLGILSGKTADGRVEVVCNQPSPQTLHSGGVLSFRAVSADVIDQAGKHYSLAELGALSDAYWKDWSERNSQI
jgi:hypothetical protein